MMFAATATNPTPSSYIVAATGNPPPAAAATSPNGNLESPPNPSALPAALNDIKLICSRRKKVRSRPNRFVSSHAFDLENQTTHPRDIRRDSLALLTQ